eukprot:COSAG04_NODE_17720_length_461_cov_0.588398_1_plen_51_part_10
MASVTCVQVAGAEAQSEPGALEMQTAASDEAAPPPRRRGVCACFGGGAAPT